MCCYIFCNLGLAVDDAMGSYSSKNLKKNSRPEQMFTVRRKFMQTYKSNHNLITNNTFWDWITSLYKNRITWHTGHASFCEQNPIFETQKIHLLTYLQVLKLVWFVMEYNRCDHHQRELLMWRYPHEKDETRRSMLIRSFRGIRLKEYWCEMRNWEWGHSEVIRDTAG